MNKAMRNAAFFSAVLLASSVALAKLPAPPPVDPAAKEAAADKAKAAAEKEKAALAAAEDYAVKNFQANMKKEGRPIPKPMPVKSASAPPAGGKKGPEANTQKASAKKKT